jgi:hypothetical protein
VGNRPGHRKPLDRPASDTRRWATVGCIAAAFYTSCDKAHFTGAVGLLNSLRLTGHDEPFVLVDAGLEDWQRELIAPAAELLEMRDLPPTMLKAAGPLARPADVMCVLDADVIVTRSLAPVLDCAREGRIVAFAADHEVHRFFPEWGDEARPAHRHEAYVAAGHLFVAGEHGLAFLRAFDDAQRQLDCSRTLLANDGLLARVTPEDPFYYADMDVLNALLSTTVAPDELAVIPYELSPYAPFPGVRIADERTLRCVGPGGAEPYVLHHILGKPWLTATRPNVYSRLLTRVLLGDDVAVPFPPERLPRRLRRGGLSAVDRQAAATRAYLHAHLRGKLGLRPRLARWRESLAS